MWTLFMDAEKAALAISLLGERKLEIGLSKR